MDSKVKFPKDFFWGASTASHQVEGNLHNNWTVWEKKNAERLANSVDKRYGWMSNLEDIRQQASDPNNYISGASVDHYHLYKKDIDIMADLGLNAYRFSIEWSRIEPTQGEFNEKEVLHYVDMIKYMRSKGITPFVTIWHWSHPVWLEEQGGILCKDFVKYFEKYTEYILKYLGSEVKYWISINEPLVIAGNAYYMGEWPPAQRSLVKTIKAVFTLARANNRVYSMIKKKSLDSCIGVASHLVAFVRGNRRLDTTFSVFFSRLLFNDLWFVLTRRHFDFVGVNNYARTRLNGFKLENDNERVNDLGWEMYPDSVYWCLEYAKRYGKPIIITENGTADSKDKYRGWYITEVIKNIKKAINEGIDVKGYFHWSLMDNFEWSHGFWPEFGLVSVDRKTQKRGVRKSAIIYANLIKKYKR